MMNPEVDLVTMADIARLADRKPAVVGNWKAREEDFPQPHSKGNRGPLYERSVVIDWLRLKGRLAGVPENQRAGFQLADVLRSQLKIDEGVPFILVILALRMAADAKNWELFLGESSDHLQEQISSAVQNILPFAECLLPRQQLDQREISVLIDSVNAIPLKDLATTADTLLHRLLNSRGPQGGEYATAPGIRDLIARIAGPCRSLYDPASGVGQLIVDCARQSGNMPPKIYCQEYNQRVWAISKLNLIIHKLEADIALGDTLFDDRFPSLQVERIVAVPPWNIQLENTEQVADDPRWIWGEPLRGRSDSNMAWVQHCIFHLEDQGRAVIAMPAGFLFQEGRVSRLRQLMLKSGTLEAVISLPPGALEAMNSACSVLVFKKGKELKQGKPSPVLMVNIENLGNRGQRSLSTSQVNDIAAIFETWSEKGTIQSELAAEVTYNSIVESGFDLSPQRYVVAPQDPSSEAELIETRDSLRRKVALSLSDCQKNDEALHELFKKGSLR